MEQLRAARGVRAAGEPENDRPFGVWDILRRTGCPDFTEINFPTDRPLQPSLVVSQGFTPGLLPTTTIQENSTIRSANGFLPTHYSLQWFFDLQRELPFSTLLTLGYIGSGTRHLLQDLNMNQPLTPGPGAIKQRRPRPFFSSIRLLQPVGSADYNAFTAKVEKRYSSGLNFLASYTWSITLT